MGNLGEAHPQCHFQYVDLYSEQSFECKKGHISKLLYYGLNPRDESHQHCGKTSSHPNIASCTNKFIDASIESDFNNICSGQPSCLFNSVKYIMNRQDDNCLQVQSQIYIQFLCEFSPQDLKSNQNAGLYVAFSCTGISVIYVILIRYLKV